MKPYDECPSFISCSSNVCPLDPDMDSKFRIKGEERCKAHKSTRSKIGSKYSELLKYKGLTSREFNGRKRWEALTHEQRKSFVEQGTKVLKTIISRQGQVAS